MVGLQRLATSTKKVLKVPDVEWVIKTPLRVFAV